MPAIAKIEPLTTTRALNGPFDYRLPEGMREVGVGSVLVVPFGRQKLLGVVVGTAERSSLPPEKLVEPVEALAAGVPPELVGLGLNIAREYSSTAARGLSLVLPPGIGPGGPTRPRVSYRRQLVAELTKEGDAAVEGNGVRLSERQRRVLGALKEGPQRVSELGRSAGADHAAVRRLESRGLLALERSTVRRKPAVSSIGERARVSSLTDHQQGALDEVVRALDGEPQPGGARAELLLHGVTGSGKTEVYIRAAAASLERGRPVIVLVPEIALTPQTVGRFQERFGDRIAVLHSKLSPGERHDEWQRLRSGEATVCVGPRSAIFAPFEGPGLIVIDEEHDSSYKQEGDPRYDARRVAAIRAAEAGSVILAGSATPRPESWRGLRHLRLPDRIDGRSLPPVEVLDMRGRESTLHPTTRRALAEVRRSEEKAILLLNRRGWAPFLICRSCGSVRGCHQCDVSLTLHRGGRAGERLICHHCGHREEVGGSCPECGSTSVARHGAGTERLERELSEALDPLPVFRLDADTTGGKDSVARVLSAFQRARAGILLGTQMVAKGHDFPEVTLGVVLDADSTLRFPDFRAEERTFALVAQLAGRSGRGPLGGKVLVQTLAPEAQSIVYAAEHDAEGFLEAELGRRRELGYPPFGELARVVCHSEDQGRVEDAALLLAQVASRQGLQVLGPAPLFRLKGRHRSQLMIKSPDRDLIVTAVGEAVRAVTKGRDHRGVSVAPDLDPQ